MFFFCGIPPTSPQKLCIFLFFISLDFWIYLLICFHFCFDDLYKNSKKQRETKYISKKIMFLRFLNIFMHKIFQRVIYFRNCSHNEVEDDDGDDGYFYFFLLLISFATFSKILQISFGLLIDMLTLPKRLICSYIYILYFRSQYGFSNSKLLFVCLQWRFLFFCFFLL